MMEEDTYSLKMEQKKNTTKDPNATLVPKDRSCNFSREELKKLKHLIEKYPVIISKKTDFASNKQKDLAWSKLETDYNADSTSFRSKKKLINKFNNLKKNARKELSCEKSGRRQTGGGPPLPKPSPDSEWLLTIMPESIVGLPSTCDSDLTYLDNSENNDSETIVRLQPYHRDIVDPLDQGSIIDIQEENDDLDRRIEESTPKKPDCMIQEKQYVFDSSTPNAMLKKSVSLQLETGKKRRMVSTPLETRNKIISMTSQKEEYIKKKGTRDELLLEFAKEEHIKNMEHKEESHKIETEFRKSLNDLLLQKASLEVEIEKEKLKKLIFENKNFADTEEYNHSSL